MASGTFISNDYRASNGEVQELINPATGEVSGS